MMIGDLLGFPHEMWPKLMDWSERTIVGGGGPRSATDDVMHAAIEFYSACSELYDEKQRVSRRRHHEHLDQGQHRRRAARARTR